MAKRQRVDDDEEHRHNEVAREEGNVSKFVQLDQSQQQTTIIQCSLTPHQSPISFSSYEDYDIHYAKVHTNRCSDCQKNFPSEHFLKLHIAENHDPINEARRARGDKIYACFVEDCDKLCLEPFKRRLHLVDKHGFPKNYDFFIVNDGLDSRRGGSMLRPVYRPKQKGASTMNQELGTGGSAHSSIRHKVASRDETNESDDDANDDEDYEEHISSKTQQKENGVDELVSSMSSLKFVPPSIRFGRGGRGGLTKR